MNTDAEKPRPAQTALLVDDEAYFRRFVGEIIRRNFPLKVVEARDGVEAVEVFRASPPDLVLLDINMPRMDGIETLTALRAISADVPIIMLTSVSEEMIVEDCVGHGATYFLRKDLPAAELIAELKQTLGDLAIKPDTWAPS